MSKLWLLLLTVLNLSGCYASDSLCNPSDSFEDGTMCQSRIVRTLKLSDEFTPEQQALVIQGGMDWEVATQGKVRLTWVVTSDAESDVFPHPGNRRQLGNFNHGNAEIWLRADMDDFNLRIVTAHELGHSFGLAHRNCNGRQVMQPKHGAQSVNELDVEHFNELYENLALDM